MAKLKCVGCKLRFPSEQMIKLPIGNVHSIECASAYGREKSRKARERAFKRSQADTKKKHAKRKKDFYDNDIKTRKKAAKDSCHAYIKARDRGRKCICCNRDLTGKGIHAGHFLESGNNPLIRYHEDNIHSQLDYCNMYQGGNSDDYEGNLRLKIGSERVDYLKANKGGTVKRTAQDYRDIEDYYRDKLKTLPSLH